jgi:ketose-bisphosphate aldolase
VTTSLKGVAVVEKWREKLQESSLQQIMRCAFEHRILVPAFNVAYLPMVPAIIEALRRTETFALLEVSRPDITRFGAESFKAVKEAFDRCGDLSLSRLHQDHVPVIDEEGELVDWCSLIEEALSLGYHSVMIDGSRLPLEENIRVTREVVRRAHGEGVCVEAELGAVLGHESGPLPPYEEIFASGRGFTDPDDAKRFVEETQVDWLSVAIGNIHGAISGAAKDAKKVEARLNIDHLRVIVERTHVPLVLHGGSGIRKEYVLQAIRHGITKINVGTEIRQAYEWTLREKGKVEEAQKAVTEKVEELIRGYYEIPGSACRIAAFL